MKSQKFKEVMDIKSILTTENTTANGIHLYLEGIFWKAYEQSAWRFIRLIQPYKLVKRYVKIVEQDVISLGFPAASLSKILQGEKYTQTDSKHIFVSCADEESAENFEQWKASVPFQPATVSSSATNQAIRTETPEETVAFLITEIERFDILNSSPMDCMQFVSRLKQYLTTC